MEVELIIIGLIEHCDTSNIRKHVTYEQQK